MAHGQSVTGTDTDECDGPQASACNPASAYAGLSIHFLGGPTDWLLNRSHIRGANITT